VPTLIAERFFMPETGPQAIREEPTAEPVRAANQ
jgi:hypothetical protein